MRRNPLEYCLMCVCIKFLSTQCTHTHKQKTTRERRKPERERESRRPRERLNRSSLKVFRCNPLERERDRKRERERRAFWRCFCCLFKGRGVAIKAFSWLLNCPSYYRYTYSGAGMEKGELISPCRRGHGWTSRGPLKGPGVK